MPVEIPTDSTVAQLQEALRAIRKHEGEEEGEEGGGEGDGVPYAFYLDGEEITASLEETLQARRARREEEAKERKAGEEAEGAEQGDELTTEDVLQIVYHPLSLFHVRPVGRCTADLPGHADAILHVSFSPDGRCLASGGGDRTVRFWDVDTETPFVTCRGHRDHVLATAWSPDGARFASGDRTGEVRVWDSPLQSSVPAYASSTTASQATEATAATAAAAATAATAARGGGRGGSASSSSSARCVVLSAHRKWITALSWEPMHQNDGRCERLASSSRDNTIKVWNVRTGRVLFSLSGHTNSVECCRWGGEGLIYSCSRDRTIKVWAMVPARAAAPTSSSSTASTSSSSTAMRGKLVRTLTGHGHRVNSLALSTDSVCRSGPFTPDRRHFDSRDEMFAVAQELYRKSTGGDRKERMVSGSDDFTLFLWSPTDSKQPITRMVGHQQLVNHMAFSPDGRYIASASFDKKIKIWCGRTGRFLSTLVGHVASVYQVAWSFDSRMVVSASKDSTVKLWMISKPNAARATLSGHMDEVYALDWSPNDAVVASGSKDRIIKIWRP